MRAGEVCDPGESKVGSEDVEDQRRHTAVTSQNGRL